MSRTHLYGSTLEVETALSIVGSVVECSPATRAARVRFPDDARNVFSALLQSLLVGRF